VKPATTILGAGLLGGAALLVVLYVVARRGLEGASLRGLLCGAGLGVANAVAGCFALHRALGKTVAAAIRAMLVGFFVRMAALIALILWFQRSGWADATIFALTFLALFFLFLVYEIRLVLRSTSPTAHPTGRPA